MRSTTKSNSTNHRRVILIFVFIAVAILLIILALTRKSVDVMVSLRVRQLSVQVSDERTARLFNSVTAHSITLSRFKRVGLGHGQLQISSQTDPKTGEPIAWREVRSSASTEQYIASYEPFANLILEAVTLNGIQITPNTQATLSWDEEEPYSLKVSFDKSVSGEMAARRQLDFSYTGCRLEAQPDAAGSASISGRLMSDREGQVISFWGREDSTILSLDMAPKTTLKEHNISINHEMDFSQLQSDRLISSVIEGKLEFPNQETPIVISEGTFVKLGQLQDAVINTIWIDNGININLSGRTSTLLTGTEGNLQNRVPSALEWIYAQHKWILALAALALIVSTLLSILDWLGIYPKPKG